MATTVIVHFAMLLAAVEPVSDQSVKISDLLLGAGGGAVLAALINFLANRRKLGADAAATLSRAAADLIGPLQERIHALEADFDRVTTKAHRLERDLDLCREANARKDLQIAALRNRHK